MRRYNSPITSVQNHQVTALEISLLLPIQTPTFYLQNGLPIQMEAEMEPNNTRCTPPLRCQLVHFEWSRYVNNGVDYLVKQFLQTTLSSDFASVSNTTGIYISDMTGKGTDYSQNGEFTKNSTIIGNVDSLNNSYNGTSYITVDFNEESLHSFMFGVVGQGAGIVYCPTY